MLSCRYMKIFVYAKTRSKYPSVRRAGDGFLEIAVKEPPRDGKANRAIAHALVEHFGIAPSRIHLVSGARTKRKVFELN